MRFDMNLYSFLPLIIRDGSRYFTKGDKIKGKSKIKSQHEFNDHVEQDNLNEN